MRHPPAGITATRPVRWGVAALVALATHPVAWALINPNFTPADLVRGSTTIVEAELHSDGSGTVTVRNPKTMKGEALTADPLAVGESAADAFPAGQESRKPALLFLANLSGAGESAEVAPAVGAVHVLDDWFGLYAREGGGYTLAADKRNLKAVWAGATPALAMAVRYVLADPARATFPVRGGVRWRGETAVCDLSQPVTGLLAVEWAAGSPPLLHVLSPVGDRLFALQDGVATNRTVAWGLTAKSVRACWTDLNGDGSLDLVNWDGKAVGAWVQGADGVLAGRDARAELSDATALVALRLAEPRRAGVAVGGDGRVVLVTLGERGVEVVATLAVPENLRKGLGAAGPIVAADFDADGCVDLAQAYEQGLVAWPGLAGGGLGAARVVWQGRFGKQVVALDVGDTDADGMLDILAGGRLGEGDGSGGNLLSNAGGWRFAPAWSQAGEVNKVQTRVRSVQVCDINSDGKFDFMLGYERCSPVFLFNRGFRTFGTCDELTLPGGVVGEGESATPLLSGDAFNSGGPFGVVADFDGDGAQDGAFVTTNGTAWVVWRERGPSCHGLLLAAPDEGPVRVTITEGSTALGAVQAVPGRPAYCGFAAKGAAKLAWTGADGKPRTRTVPVLRPLTRVELKD